MTNTPADGGADYADKDLPGWAVDPGPGAYTDQQTPPEARGEEPDPRGSGDTGEYTDSAGDDRGRAAPAEGSFTSKDTSKDTDTGTDEVEEHPHG